MRRALVILGLMAALACAPATAGDTKEASEKKPCSGTMESCLLSMIDRFKKTGLIGLDGEWDQEIGGYRIEKFLEASVAEAAGVKVGDILIKVNGIPLTDEKAAKADAENRKPGKEVSITVLRGDEPMTVKVSLIPFPADIVAREIGLHMMESHSPAAAAKQD